MSSDNKEESNSPQLDVREDDSMNDDDDCQVIDESSVDSEPKNEKDKLKKENDKEESEKEDSGKEESEKDESEKDESDKDEKESEEENGEKEMGLLDRPVEVTGCRARKQVDRLEVSFSTPKEKHEIVEGSGKKLGECPRIEFQISKHAVADLKPLHRILYSRPGSAHDTKKNIRKFSGFDFRRIDMKFENKRVSMEKLNTSTLKVICEVLDLERGGTKDEIINRIMEFLMEPKDSGKALPKKKGSGRDKKRTPGKKTKTTKRKPKAKAIVTDDYDDDDEEDHDIYVSDGDEDAGDVDDDDDDDEEEGSDFESKKKSKNTPKRKTSKTKAVKKEKPKKESKGTKRKRDDTPSDSSDDEPVLKKSKMPSDEEIKKLVKRILDNADLEEITMKKVIKQVFDTYPDCDLSHKKAFIKMTIKSVIS